MANQKIKTSELDEKITLGDNDDVIIIDNDVDPAKTKRVANTVFKDQIMSDAYAFSCLLS